MSNHELRHHKYIARVKVTPRKWRYFYDKDEYEAYLKAKQKTDALRSNINNPSENAIVKNSTMIRKDGKTTIKSTTNDVSRRSDGSLDVVTKTITISTDVTPAWMEKAAKKINKGREFVSGIVDRIFK